jgi:murein L,D-transpeptidase YafK
MALRFSSSYAKAGAVAALLGLAACDDGGSLANRSLAPIPSETLALMDEAGVAKDSPVLIRAFKKEAEFEVWKMRPDGSYVHLKTYPMCRWSGQLGPKIKEGDRQVPEGFYSIAPGQLNPNSSYYLSFNVGYPNAYDRALGHTGGTIMVHGACSSAGCFSMTDRQIAEIYAIARTSLNAGQSAIQMQSYPFRMTAENLAKHRLDPNIGFWRQLKEGNDHFEVTKKEPSVGVCGKRYVFGATSQHLDPEAPCPVLKRDPEVARLVAEKAARDDAKVAELAAGGIKPVRLVYQDGGQHPYFTARMAEVSRPELLVPPTEIVLDERPTGGGAKSPGKPRPAFAGAPAARVAAAPAGVAGPAAPQTKIAAQLSSPASADWMSLHREPERAGVKEKDGTKKSKDAAKDAARNIKIGALTKVLKDPQPTTK